MVVLAIGGTDRNVQIWARSESLVRVVNVAFSVTLSFVQFMHAATLSGHEDWVRSLAFREPVGGHPSILASGSQDATIRLWTIEQWQKESLTTLSDELLDAFEASLGDLGENEEGGKQISLKRHIMTVRSNQGR